MRSGARRRGWTRRRRPRPQTTCATASPSRTSTLSTRQSLIKAYASAAARLDARRRRPRPQATCANRLAKPDLDLHARRSLIQAYGSAAARLDALEAAKAVSAPARPPRQAGPRPECVSDPCVWERGGAAGRAGGGQGRKRPARARLAKPDLDLITRQSLIYVYGSAAARLDAPEAIKATSDLRDRLAKPDLDLGYAVVL